MKRSLTLLLISLLVLQLTACRNHIEVTTYWDAAKKHIKERYEVLSRNTNIKDGLYENYFRSGTIANKFYFSNNKLQDSCIIYNESPYYRSEQLFYQNGLRNGVRILFYPTGKWKIIEHYLQDKLEGEYTHYDEAGKLLEEGQFKNGQMDGLWTFYYPNSTQIKEKVNFIQGQEMGYYESYYSNGKKKSDGYYKGEDNMDSLWHLYYETGELMEDAIYKNNWEEGLTHTYDKSKRVTKEILYHKGKVLKYADFVKHIFTEHPENAIEDTTNLTNE
jgi:antitoxin component YwqK of YwqJK toxin-antitoxin module